MPTAYSVVRFSHLNQKLGDSARRQVASSRAWCERHGYTLDESLRARDVSAFRGKQTKVGALASALAAIQEGLIRPPSALIVESLDRISRQNLDAARELARGILLTGVDLVTFMPERHYTKASLDDPLSLMEMSLIFARAHEESVAKSHRIAEQWAERRKSAREGRHSNGKLCPWWLAPKDGGYEILPERADVIRKLYEWKADGHGAATVTKMVNALEGIPSPSRGKVWSTSTVNNYLRTRTVLGEFQPQRLIEGRKVPDGDPVKGYYPPIVETEVFHQAQASFRGAQPGRNPVGDDILNIFGSLLYNGNDGHRLYMFTHTRQWKGEKLISRDLMSMGARSHVTDADKSRISYRVFEAAFLRFVAELKPADFLPNNDPLHAEIARVVGAIAEAEQRIDELKVKHKTTPRGQGAVLLDMILEADAERTALVERLDELKDQESNHAAGVVTDLQGMASMLAESPDPKGLRTKIRSRINHLVERITVHPSVTKPRKHAPDLDVQVVVEFRDGRLRWYSHDHKGDGDVNLYGFVSGDLEVCGKVYRSSEG